MALSYTSAIRSARVTAIGTALDGGSGAGVINFYSGSVPADADASLGAAELLATCELSDPALDDVTAGVGTFDTIAVGNIVASGTVSFFRATSSTPTTVVQGTAGDAGTEDIVFDDADLVVGGTVEVTSLTLTDGTD